MTDPSPGAAPRLLRTKLTPPVSLPRQTVRRAVVDAVCSAQGVKLVLLRAPAGFGKSTVMLQCMERVQATGVATAWLTVDRADNDASRFLAGLEAAVDTLFDGDEETPRGQDTGRRRADDFAHAKAARHGMRVHWPHATEGDERVAARVSAPLGGVHLGRCDHIVVHDIDNTPGEPHQI